MVVNDPDRATDSASALRAIREAVGKREIVVVVATGSHVWSDEAKLAHETPLRAAAGKPTRFHWHDGAKGAHVEVGPARLDAVVAGARDVVAVGSVEPHWFAGLTGAHKTVTVGIMQADDIAANHLRAMSPKARPFRLEGNPVHEGLARVVEDLAKGRKLVAVQHVLSRWFAGPPLKCLAEAAPLVETRWRRKIGKPFDFVVATVEPPLSRTLYQAEKAIKNNESAVKDGGVFVVDAACEDGLGPDRYFQLLLRAPDVEAVQEEIARKGYRLGDHKAQRLRALQGRGVKIALVSPTFPQKAAEAIGWTVHRSRGAAAKSLRAEFGAASRGALIEDAAHVVVETR